MGDYDDGANGEDWRRSSTTTAIEKKGPEFAPDAAGGGVPTSTVDAGMVPLYSPSNGTGSTAWGQSFTADSGGTVTSIKTTAIGGVTGTQLTNGIAASSMRIREWVNNVETGMPGFTDHAVSGAVLAGGNSTSTELIDYEYSEIFPTVEFHFSGHPVLSPNASYVMEFLPGSGVWPYVKIYSSTPPGDYTEGQAYDINGNNLSFTRDYPFQVWTYN